MTFKPTTIDELDAILGPASWDSAALAVPAPAPIVAAVETACDEADAFHAARGHATVDKTSPYFHPCKKCNGSGIYRGYSRYGSTCFTCKGTGGKMLKTTREDAAAAKVAKAARAAREVESKLEAFARTYPEEYASLLAGKEKGKSFQIDMLQCIAQYGHLTERQMTAVQNGMERERQWAEQRAAEKAAEAARAPLVTDKLEQAFAAMHANGLKRPVLRFAGFTVSEAGATSKNAGALYLKDGGTYLGKIAGGKLFASYDGKQRTGLVEAIESAMVDPVASAKAFGRETGRCSCCGRTLTDPVSVANGIGPICEANAGW